MHTTTRLYTNKLLELIDDDLLNAKDIVLMALNHMSEQDVQDMVKANELSSLFKDINEEE